MGGQTSGTGLEGLCAKLNRRWETLNLARDRTDGLVKSLSASLDRLIPSDASFVTFGSIARGEYSPGSDVDWTLLVDGQADPGHFTAAQAIARELKAQRLEPPGPTATFGSVTFSHELVHHIGGQSDSNRNTTQRILLLLESSCIGTADAYERVIRAVLSRYLDNDIGFLTQSRSGERYKVPRFLLNDIVRYWRTMCVDYATKFRERQAVEWALRNAKLRMSRKLIFASGLMICFSGYLQPPALPETLFDVHSHVFSPGPMVAHLRSFVGKPPIDIMADAFSAYTSENTAISFFDAYARFIEILSDGSKRESLEALPADRARIDPTFAEIRRLADSFQIALNTLFFESTEQKLRDLTFKYGLF